ncbi:MAG: hypothetical protein ACE5GZ_01895 [Gammaproteobacteria bacterium]
MYRVIAPVFTALLAISSYVSATVQTDEIDPVAVSPDKYRVLLENEYVRVVEYRVNPGEHDNWHTHPAKVSYVVSGGTLKITTGEGKSFVVEEESASTRWFGAVGRHFGENVGDTTVRIVFVEIKGIDTIKEDLNKFVSDGNNR